MYKAAQDISRTLENLQQHVAICLVELCISVHCLQTCAGAEGSPGRVAIYQSLYHRYLLTSVKENEAIAKRYGCLPPPKLQNQRPLGLDRLEQIFRANAESRLMELFLFHFRQTGYTLEQRFLRAQAFGTVDPANLEVILSTNFSGLCPYFVTFGAMSSDTVLTPPRLGHGTTTTDHVSHVWRWHLHSRRRAVEALAGNAEAAVRAQAV